MEARLQDSEPPTPHSVKKMGLRDRASSMEDPDGTLASVAQCIEQLRRSSSTVQEKESSLKQLLDLIDTHENAFGAVGSHSQAVPILVSLLRSGSLGVKIQAATVLGTLCKEDELRVKVLLGGCVPPLLGLLRSSSTEAQVAAAKAIYAVSQDGATDHVGSKIFSTEAVVPVLWEQLENGPKAGNLVDNLLTGALKNLSSSTEGFWSATIKAGGVNILVKLLTTGQSSTQANVCFLLACMMMEDASICSRVLEAQATKKLLKLVGSGNEASVRAEAAGALKSLSAQCKEARREIANSNGIPALINATIAPSKEFMQGEYAQALQENAMCALANISGGLSYVISSLGESLDSCTSPQQTADTLGALASALMIYDSKAEAIRAEFSNMFHLYDDDSFWGKYHPLLLEKITYHLRNCLHKSANSYSTPMNKAGDGAYDVPEGVDIRGRYDAEFANILTKDALQFVANLQREFRNRVKYALECRKEAQSKYNAGALPGFDPATKYVREGEWVCAPVPQAVADRKVEITGPTERKMVINALNSGAKVFMADFEDALSPTWENLMRGQVNLRDAVEGTISFQDKARNRVYKLNDQTAKLFVRPRGWHLPEAHILIDGEPATGCLVDFGLYFYHNYAAFRKNQGAGYGPFFYLPKMQHSREAKIWNCVFESAEKMAGIEKGSIRATVLIETLPAVFQMDEILHELRDHSVGLNCGRWDYIFSYVKTFQNHPDRLLPDRVLVGMGQHFMRSYSDLLIRTCHRRGVHAMGGMAAQIPIRDDPAANEAALELVRKDKLREVHAGHDGTWAAHPGLIPVIMEVFMNNMGNAPHQIHTMKREDADNLTEEDLIQKPRGVRTLEGLRLNTRVGIQYLAAWLTGTGSVPLYNLMEDAATAEISRVQNWQWLKYGVSLDGDGLGVNVNLELFSRVVEEEMARIEREVGPEKFRRGMYKEARKLFTRQCTTPNLDDFLTLDAYNHIVLHHPNGSARL